METSEGPDQNSVEYVEPAHEALIRAWDKVLEWRKGEVEKLPLQRAITEATYGTGGLWTNDKRLSRAEELLAADPYWLNTEESRFIWESVRRRTLTIRVLWGSISGVVVVLSVLTLWALIQARTSRSAALAANALILLNTDPDRSIPLAMEAAQVRRTPQAENALRQTLLRSYGRGKLIDGHSPLTGVAYSPDGNWIVVTRDDGTAQVWDVRKRQMRAGLSAKTLNSDDTDTTISVGTFSIDSKRVVLQDGSGYVRLWDFAAGAAVTIPTEAVRVSPGSKGSVRFIAVAKSGKTEIWNAATAQRFSEVPGEPLALSPDGAVLLVRDTHQHLLVKQVVGRGAPRQMPHLPDYLNRFQFSNEGHYLLLTSLNGGEPTAALYDTRAGKSPVILEGHTDTIGYACFSPDSQRLVTAARWSSTESGGGRERDIDTVARLWEVSSGTLISRLPGHADVLTGVSYSANGKFITTASQDTTVRVWDAFSGNLHAELLGHHDTVSATAFSPAGQNIITSSADGTLRLWDCGTGALVVGPNGSHFVFSSGGKFAASWDEENRVAIWATDTWTKQGLPPLQEQVDGIDVSLDGRRAVTVSGGIARVWDVKQQKVLCETPLGTEPTKSAAISPSGRFLATMTGNPALASGDDEVLIWDARSLPGRLAAPLYHLKGHTNFVIGGVFSQDEQWFASYGSDKTLFLWNTKEWKGKTPVLSPQHRLEGLRAWVLCATFSPDSRLLLAGARDGSLGMWDVNRGARLSVVRGHAGVVSCVAFDPSSHLALSGSDDKTVRIWDGHNGQALATYLGYTEAVDGVAFAPDGNTWLSQDGNSLRACACDASGNFDRLLDHGDRRLK